MAQGFIGAAALVGAALGALLDLYSLALWLRRMKNGRGPSGVSGVSWILYFAFAMSRQSLTLLAILSVFHAACHWLIPGLYRRTTGR